MKAVIFVILYFLQICSAFGQHDTQVTKSQKGYLFLSSQHYMYDWPNGDEIRTGFHDYFFPIDSFNMKSFIDSSKTFVLNKGLRVEFFKSRNQLKKSATKFNCKDTSGCYAYDKFYIIPIEIDFKVFFDNWPPACRKEYFNIEIRNGAKVILFHQQKAIQILKIKETFKYKLI